VATERSAPAVANALVVSASLLGDTLLYTVLPVQASSLGVSRPTVGVILSLNRWVRLGTNPLAARLYERLPAGPLVLAAILLTGVATSMYALPTALAVFFAGRLLWGFCYSLLRLGSFLAALDYAVLFPLEGLDNPASSLTAKPAQLVRLRLNYLF
jgi:predicted MFS family arabinose efflux permease